MMTLDGLAQRLESALGRDALLADDASLVRYAIGAAAPALVCLPRTADEVAAALRVCFDGRAAIVCWGGGSAIQVGNSPRRFDVVLALGRLNQLVEHDPANLTATAESGIVVADLQKLLAAQKQFVTMDPPEPQRATLGGTIAAGLNGVRRMSYGGLRDLVIGMKVALIGGDPIKAGGKVVKNVAGYDMCKLFTGSFGTLGVITEATFRLAPLPETAATFLACGSFQQVWKLVREIFLSFLLPASVVVLSNGATESTATLGEGFTAAVWCEGFERSVTRHVRELQELAEQNRVQAQPTLAQEAHRRFWSEIADFPLLPERVTYRLTVPPQSIMDVITTIGSWPAAENFAGIMAEAGSGAVWIGCSAAAAAIPWFEKLIALAREHRGHAMLFSAPPHLAAGTDVWGPPPPALNLMREMKRQFDPEGLLSPGRYVGGI